MRCVLAGGTRDTRAADELLCGDGERDPVLGRVLVPAVIERLEPRLGDGPAPYHARRSRPACHCHAPHCQRAARSRARRQRVVVSAWERVPAPAASLGLVAAQARLDGPAVGTRRTPAVTPHSPRTSPRSPHCWPPGLTEGDWIGGGWRKTSRSTRRTESRARYRWTNVTLASCGATERASAHVGRERRVLLR